MNLIQKQVIVAISIEEMLRVLFAESAWNAFTTETSVPPIHNLTSEDYDEMLRRAQNSYEQFTQMFAGYIADKTPKEGEDGQWNLVMTVSNGFAIPLLKKVENIIQSKTLWEIYQSQYQARELAEYYEKQYIGALSALKAYLAR